MKPGITLRQAQAELNLIASNLERLYPKDDTVKGIAAVPLEQHVVADVRGALWTLLGAPSVCCCSSPAQISPTCC